VMKVMAEKVLSLIIKEEVDIIIAPFSPTFLIAVAPLLESNEVLLLLTYMVEDTIHEECQSEFTFINTFDLVKSAWLQGYSAGKRYGLNGTFLGAIHDIGYGTSRAFTMGFEAVGGKLAFSALTHKNSRTESPAEAIGQALEEKPDFTFGFYSGKEGISFANTWDEIEGKKPPFIPSYMQHADDVLEICGEKMVGQKTFGCWDRDNEGKANVALKVFFNESLRKKPNPYGLMAYETGEMLGKALLKTGSDTPAPQVLKIALTEVSIIGPRGEISFDAATQMTATTDYEFEIVKEGDGRIVRKKLGVIEVPAEYDEYLAWCIKSLVKDGWTNPYLIA
jgi:ABC-type branched-subunit amino acid transport system substrate-binding protein